MDTDKVKANKELFILVYPTKAFNVSKTCREIGISRDIFRYWLEKDPEFAKAVEDCRQAKIDQYEQNLLDQSTNGSYVATIFALKSLAKDRGYSEEQQFKVDLGKIEIEIVSKDTLKGEDIDENKSN